MKKRIVALGLTLLVAAPALVGCKATAESAADDTKIYTMLPAKNIDPPRAGNNTVYLQWQDQTGQDIDVWDEVASAIRARGYEVTSNYYEADYVLWATLRMFDKKDEDFNERMAALGGIAGGVATGVAVAEATDNYWYGAAAGTAGGGLTAMAIGSLTAENVWAMVVDVQLGRKIEGGVQTDRSSGSDDEGVSNTAQGTPGGIEQGSGVERDTSSQQITEVRAHYELGQRILGETKGTRMDRATARQALAPRMKSSIQNLLPRVF